ncbi:MAG: hypothetical protein RLZZ303_2659 [Candidatus Hydrogenedentota bacterium]
MFGDCCRGGLAVVCLLAAFSFFASTSSAIEVLLIWDESVDEIPETPRPPLAGSLAPQTQGLIAALEGAGFDVTLATNPFYAGGLPAPADFDVLLHLNGNVNPTEFDDILSTGDAAAVEQYVRSGGGYVGCGNGPVQVEQPGGSRLDDFVILEQLAGAPPAFGEQTFTLTPEGLGHPVFVGLGNSFTFEAELLKCGVRNYGGSFDAVSLATDGDGNDAIAVRELNQGRVVYFSHRGNYLGPDTRTNTLLEPEAQQLFVNAIRWADQRAPQVASIEVDGPLVSNGSGIAFLVHFSESVTGVDLNDFAFVAPTLSVGSLTLTPLDGKTYRIEADSATGSGLLQLEVLNDGSIQDESDSQNPLSAGLIGFDGIIVDSIAPGVESVSTQPFAAGTGDTPTLVIEFNESMKSTISPTLSLTTASNGSIPLTGGFWAAADRYEAVLGRVLTNADAGLVSVTVSGAQDFVGNVMTAYSDTPFSFGSTGLTALISQSGLVFAEAGKSISFSVTLLGLVGTPQYEWKKEVDTKALINVGGNDPTLTLSNLTFADSGTYFCVVSDDADVTQTPNIHLTVVASLPVGGGWVLALLVSIVAALACVSLRPKRRA